METNKNKKIATVIVALVVLCLLYAVFSTFVFNVGYEVVEAEVTAVEESTSNYNYKSTIEFEYGGETYSFTQRTDEYYAVGESVKVTFDTGYPSDAEIYEQNYVLELFTNFVGGIFTIGFWAVLIYVFYSSSKRAKLQMQRERSVEPEEMNDIFGDDYVPRPEFADIFDPNISFGGDIFGREYSNVDYDAIQEEIVVPQNSEITFDSSGKMYVDGELFTSEENQTDEMKLIGDAAVSEVVPESEEAVHKVAMNEIVTKQDEVICEKPLNEKVEPIAVQDNPFEKKSEPMEVNKTKEAVEPIKIDETKMQEILEKDVYKNPYDFSSSQNTFGFEPKSDSDKSNSDGYGKSDSESRFGDDGYYDDGGYGKKDDETKN